MSLCLNLLPFVVCLLQTLALYCANLLLRAFEGKRVLNGLACEYTKSHLDYMLHALGENLYILTSTTSTNTEIPTWTTYSEWEFVCFNKYRNTLICKCQIMKYLNIQILRYTHTCEYKYKKYSAPERWSPWISWGGSRTPRGCCRYVVAGENLFFKI